MTLRIEILSGPGAGTVHLFDDGESLVEIGRDPDYCKVLFPADLTTVGRRHLAIRNSGGHYGLETNLRNPVLIDGREPFDGEPLEGEHEIRLGPDGPLLRVTTRLDSALPETRIDAIGLTASQETRRASRGLGIVLSLVAVLALGALGGLGYMMKARLDESRALAEIAARMEKVEGTETMSPAVMKAVSRSVYLVLMLSPDGAETPIGTSWVYGEGLLATNAHVAVSFTRRTPGDRMIVRSTVAPYRTFAVEDVAIHPDYALFTEVWQNTKPFRAVAGDVELLDAPGEGYDVALLRAEAGSDLGPALTVADSREMEALQAGDAVGYAGFPMERLASGGINPVAPVPQVQLGNVTAVSDYFLLPSMPAESYLIQHSIPATGGASGSPMVNRAGHVVGLVSGINIIETSDGERAPNAVNINFAQRADLLAELPDGPTPERHALREMAWQLGFSTFKDPLEAIPAKVVKEWLSSNPDVSGDDLTLMIEERFDMERDPAEEIYLRRYAAAITEPGRYLMLALSAKRSDIDLALFSGTDEVSSDKALDWYPSLVITQTDSEPLDLVVSSGMADEVPDVVLRVWRLPPDSTN